MAQYYKASDYFGPRGRNSGDRQHVANEPWGIEYGQHAEELVPEAEYDYEHDYRQHRPPEDQGRASGYAYAYEDGGDSGSYLGSDPTDNEFEPAWADAVTSKGDVFYLEGPEEESPNRHGGPTRQDPLQNGEQWHPNANHSLASSEVKKRGRRKLWGGMKKSEQINGSIQNDQASHSVTFKDVPTGVMRDVALYVDPVRNNYGRRASLCETLFGIIPGLFCTQSKGDSIGVSDKRIMVQGLLPGGEALKSGIKIGEWLMEVNGREVDIDSIDAALSSISGPQLVSLRLQKIAIETSPRPSMVKKNNVINNKLVRLVSGEQVGEPVQSLYSVPHGVLYVTLDCNSDNVQGKEDVVYQFPHSDTKMVDVRGMFITLSHVLLDVTDNTAKNSTLLVDGKLVYVGYAKESREVLLLTVPADKLCLAQVNQLMDDVIRILRILYGSLHSAFSTPDNHQRIDHFFAIMLQRFLLSEELLKDGAKQTELLEPFLQLLPGVRALTVPEETKVVANNCLSDFEAADFADMADEYYDMRRSYTILGSCLFYKGYLLCNHLHREDLVDIYLYAHHHCLLTLCHHDQLSQLLVWKELFPTRTCHKQVDPLIPGYSEPEARSFLLLVGRRNALLGVLLEAGGCASWAEGNPAPEPFYVDQARATLVQLEAKDVFHQCEIRLQNPSMVTLACADYFLPVQKRSKSEQSTAVKTSFTKSNTTTLGKKTAQPESILKKRTPALQFDSQRYDVTALFEDSDDDIQSTGTSEGSVPYVDRHSHSRKMSQGSDESVGSGSSASVFKTSKKRRSLPSAYDLGGLQRTLSDAADEGGSFVKLTSGLYNTLFHYVQLDTMEGVYICPTQQELLQVTTPTHAKILQNFQQACLAIRQVFANSAMLREQRELGLPDSKFGSDWSMEHVQEHGVLFQCQAEGRMDTRKAAPVLSYWVVGRVFQKPYQREFYVCFHDSAHQNLVEMAFKLAFGVLV